MVVGDKTNRDEPQGIDPHKVPIDPSLQSAIPQPSDSHSNSFISSSLLPHTEIDLLRDVTTLNESMGDAPFPMEASGHHDWRNTAAFDRAMNRFREQGSIKETTLSQLDPGHTSWSLYLLYAASKVHAVANHMYSQPPSRSRVKPGSVSHISTANKYRDYASEAATAIYNGEMSIDQADRHKLVFLATAADFTDRAISIKKETGQWPEELWSVNDDSADPGTPAQSPVFLAPARVLAVYLQRQAPPSDDPIAFRRGFDTAIGTHRSWHGAWTVRENGRRGHKLERRVAVAREDHTTAAAELNSVSPAPDAPGRD